MYLLFGKWQNPKVLLKNRLDIYTYCTISNISSWTLISSVHTMLRVPTIWGIFSIIKVPLKLNLQPNIKYFLITFVNMCSFLRFKKNSYIPQRSGKKIETCSGKRKFQKKKTSALIPKLGFGCYYDLVSHPFCSNLPYPN